VSLARPLQLALYGLTLLVVFTVALSSQTHFDFWWYLKSGEHILATRSIPDRDPFSFTAQGRPWINHMWLTQVVLYWLYEHAGRVAIIVGKSLLVTATFGVLLGHALRRGAHPLIAVAVTALAAVAGEAYWHVRPQIVTYLGLALYLYVLRDGWEERLRQLLWLPLLMVPWANLHAGFVSGLGLLALIVFGATLERLLAPRPAWRPLAWLALASAAAGVASLLNPFGIRALLFPVEVVSSREFMTTTIEWFSPNFHDSRHRPFEVMILLLFAGMSLSRRIRLADVVLAVGFTHLGLASIRHIPLFVIAMTPVLASTLTEAVTRVWAARTTRVEAVLRAAAVHLPSIWPLARSPHTHAAIAACLLLAMLAGYGSRVADPRTGAIAQDLNEARYPIRSVEFMKRERVPGPLFNLYLWGGYELWRLYPDYQVFFDGRTHVYGEAVVRDYLAVAMAHPDWKAVLDRWNIQSVLTAPSSPLTQALDASQDWRLVFVDQEALLFVRNAGAHRALFDRIGPVARAVPRRVVRAALGAAMRAAERGDDDTAVRQLQEVLALDRDNPVALYSLGMLLERKGDRRGAERAWGELRRVAPESELASRAEAALRKRGGSGASP
jgi:hypothetical protein